LGTSLEHTFVTKLEKVNQTHKFINNKQVQEQLHDMGIQLIKPNQSKYKSSNIKIKVHQKVLKQIKET